MTSIQINYLQVLIAILIFLIPIRELIIKKGDKKGLHKITLTGWICFLIAIAFGFVSFYGISISQHEKRTETLTADSIRKADKNELIDSFKRLKVFDTTIIKQNNKTTIVYSKDSNYYGVPDIELISYDAKYSKNDDTIIQTMDFENLSNVDAYYFNWSSIMVCKYQGKYYVYRKGRIYVNETLSKGRGFIYNQTVPNFLPVCDTIYVYIQSSYSNYYKKVNKRYDKLIEWWFKNKTWGFASPAKSNTVLSEIKKSLDDL